MWQQHFASPNAPRSLRAETLWLLSELMLEKSHPVSRVREAINLLRSDEDISWEKAVHTVCASRIAAVPCLAIPLSAPAMFDVMQKATAPGVGTPCQRKAQNVKAKEHPKRAHRRSGQGNGRPVGFRDEEAAIGPDCAGKGDDRRTFAL